MYYINKQISKIKKVSLHQAVTNTGEKGNIFILGHESCIGLRTIRAGPQNRTASHLVLGHFHKLFPVLSKSVTVPTPFGSVFRGYNSIAKVGPLTKKRGY